ncbi:hypothetical protein ACTXI9_01500 [Brachybacterium alimentarium]|uniref:hypothetical protein n=1 Tax=Brachybacterium alimentarium TaxID=47845 RepID=UPI003FD0B9B5
MPKKFVRKSKKQYPMVEFTLPDIYGDAKIVLPSTESMPMKVQAAAERNQVSPMLDVWREAGVDEETLEAISDLDGDEVPDLIKAWNDASKVPTGKSKA